MGNTFRAGTTDTSPTLRLTLLGGVALTRADGGELGPAASQRRPLAVMVLVALSGETGISRDKLTSVLWPDSDFDRGRRALTQTLYSLRRSTGVEDLFQGNADLRLNQELVSCDALAFEDALRNDRTDLAAGLYRGPLCDGFIVPGAGEFERWLSMEQQRYARLFADALGALIREARSRGDARSEVEWCRRLFDTDPLDSEAMLLLLDAATRSNDAAMAERCFRVHEKALREELEVDPSPAVAAKLAVMRAAVAVRPAASREQSPRASGPVSRTSPAEDSTPRLQAAPPASRWRRRSLSLSAVALAAILLLIAALLYTGLPSTNAVGTAQAAAPMRSGVIAILPFEVETRDESLAFLGTGAANFLFRTLNGDAGPRAVEPEVVLTALDSARRLHRGGGGAAATGRALEVARRVGAGEVLVGGIRGTAAHLVIHASILDGHTGEAKARAEFSGPADSLSALMDGLAADLVAQSTVGSERSIAFTGARFGILKTFLQAEAAYQSDRYRDALVLYERALDVDSTFAPAALGLAMAADRLNSAEQHDRGLALAWAQQDRLGTHDRAYLIALAGPRYPEPSPASEQMNAWEQVVALSPEKASAWAELGERFLYDGSLLGLSTPNVRAAAAFRRALELDPGDVAARRNLIEVAIRAGDRQNLARIATTDRIRRVGGELTGYLMWRVSIELGDSTALSRIRSRFPSLGEPSLRAIAMSSQHEIVGLADGERALRLLAGRAALGSEQLDVLLAQHSLALNRGRPLVALDITEQLQDAQPGSRAHLRLRLLDALYADGDSTAARNAADELARAVAQAPLDAQSHATRLADVCVLAQWKAAPWRQARATSRAERAELRGFVSEMREGRRPWATVPVAASTRACAGIVEAMAAVSSRSSDAREKVRRLDALMLTGPALSDGGTWATLAIARLYERLGDDERALAVVRQRPFMKGWPRYLSTSLATEARLAKARGDMAGEQLALARLRVLRESKGR